MNNKINLRHKQRQNILVSILGLEVGYLLIRSESPTGVLCGFIFIAAIFVVSGFFDRLIYEKEKNELIHQKGWYFPFKVKKYKIKNIKRIELFFKISKYKNDVSSTTYAIRLVGIKDSTILVYGDVFFARHITELIASKIQLPMNNRAYKSSSMRAHDELDLSIIQRWKKNNIKIEQPEEIEDPNITISSGKSSFKVLLPQDWLPKYIALAMFLIVVFVISFFPKLNFLIIVFFPLFLIIFLSFIGKSKLTINNKKVTFRQGLSPFRKNISINEIEELIVDNDEIFLIGDKKHLCIHGCIHKYDLMNFKGLVCYELFRLGCFR